ncbi:MAG: cell division FtsK/SpoIIIE [Mycobacterium sp.]|nr:cell division FtsK/SpoIIIE [Mycobacterium sp.]
MPLTWDDRTDYPGAVKARTERERQRETIAEALTDAGRVLAETERLRVAGAPLLGTSAAQSHADRRERLADRLTRLTAERDQADRDLAAQQAILELVLDRLLPSPYASVAWNDPHWEEWQPPEDLPDAVRLGTLRLDTASGAVPTVAVCPVLEHPTVILAEETGSLEAATTALQVLTARLIASCPPGTLRVSLADLAAFGSRLGAVGGTAAPLRVGPTATSPVQLRAMLDEIGTHMVRLNTSGALAAGPLTDQVRQHLPGHEPLRLVVAAGLPADLPTDLWRQLGAIARNGPACGVHLVVLPEVYAREDRDKLLTLLGEHAVVLRAADGELRLSTYDDTLGSITPYRLFSDAAPGPVQRALLAESLPRASVGTLQAPALLDMLTDAPERSSRDGLAIPAGLTADGEIWSLFVNDAAPHGLLAGQSGSGKSTLLHGLVQSASTLYAPDELQLVMLDLKQGVEFAEYLQDATTPELPHIRLLGIDVDAYQALEVLRWLVAENSRRQRLFLAAGERSSTAVRNIYEYRRLTGEPLPRLLAVIDEFQQLFAPDVSEEAWTHLQTIAKLGRSQGMHLLLATQGLTGMAGGIREREPVFAQLATRMALRCRPADAVEVLGPGRSGSVAELRRQGEMIVAAAGGAMSEDQRVRVAFMDPQQRRRLRTERALALPPAPPVDTVRVIRGDQRVQLSGMRVLGAVGPEAVPLGMTCVLREPVARVDLRPRRGRGVALVARSAPLATAALATPAAVLAAGDDGRPVVIVDEDGRHLAELEGLLEWLGPRGRVLDDLPADAAGAAALAAALPEPSIVILLDVRHPDQFGPGTLAELASGKEGHTVLTWLRPEAWHQCARVLRDMQVRLGRDMPVTELSATLGARPPHPAPDGYLWWTDLGSGRPPRLVRPAVAPTAGSLEADLGIAGGRRVISLDPASPRPVAP